MDRFFVPLCTFVLCLGLLLGGPTSAYSQEKNSDEFTLEEVTVTAQKRDENQQKVAIPMEVVAGEDIKQLGKNDISQILNTVSSVIINTNEDGLRVSIRGISNDNPVFQNMQASTPTVAVNSDGIYTNRNSSNTNLYDVERVEVLFGPQSTMYASASPGGIVNIITSNPKLDQYGASGTLEYGSYELLHTEGMMNAPVTGTIAFRAAFSTSQRDGYLSNGGDDEDAKSARLKTLYQPIENFSIVLTGEINKKGGAGFSKAKAFVKQDDDYYPDGTKLTDPWTSDTDTAPMGMDRETKRISGQIDWNMGYAGALSVIPTYSKSTNYSQGITTGFAMPGMPAIEQLSTNSGEQIEKGVEARMTSSEDFPFKWIIGGNLYESSDEQNSVSVEQGVENPQTSTSLNSNEQKIKAIYANITYPFTDSFRATAGVRQTWDKNSTYSASSNRGTEIHEQEYRDPSYKVGFEYDLAGNSMLYGDFSTSYRTQGMAFDATGKPFDPEELMAYTLGAKNRFFDNRLQLNVAAYDYEYKNYMGAVGAPVMVPPDANGNGVIDPEEEMLQPIEDPGTKQVGDARVYGLDLQTTTIITENDKLDLSVSYIRKYFTDLKFDFSWVANDYLNVPDIDYSGQDMSLAPRWTINGTYSHNFSLPDGGSLTARLDARYRSEYTLSWSIGTPSYSKGEDGIYYSTITPASPARFQEAYHTEDISIFYTNPDGKWTLTAYVKNVANYAVKRSLIAMGGPASLMLGPPRTIGAVLSVKY